MAKPFFEVKQSAMKLFSLHTYPRVYIYATSDFVLAEWSAALRTVGLRISVVQDESRLPALQNGLLLLLNPDALLLQRVKQYLHSHEQSCNNLYVVSDDAAWSDLSLEYSFHLLSFSTHPLEAARIFNHTKKAIPRNYFARYASLFNF